MSAQLLAERGAQSMRSRSTLMLGGEVKPCSQRSLRTQAAVLASNCQGPRTILPSGLHPSLGINKNTLMAPMEVQLTWPEAWATGWSESCRGDFLDTRVESHHLIQALPSTEMETDTQKEELVTLRTRPIALEPGVFVPPNQCAP